MNVASEHLTIRYKNIQWLLVLAVVVFMGVLYYRGFIDLVSRWQTQEEYSHGYLIPLVSLFLIWLSRDKLDELQLRGSRFGLILVALSLVIYFLGDLSTIYLVVHYSFVLLLFSLVITFFGWQGLRVLWVPVFFLVFMIPLPPFLHNIISGKLQLISSELGVSFIRLFDISVFLEGNVIDLGVMKLQVVEACNGLRYLFPLMSFGFLAAYFYDARLWQRLIVFVSSVPITVIMNSLRIGVIGILVEYWGVSMAQGFLHDFEGWFVFMLCTGILLAEIWLLNRLFGKKRSFREAFKIILPKDNSISGIFRFERQSGKVGIPVTILLAIAVAIALLIQHRAEVTPARKVFAEFPMQFTDWQGKKSKIENIYLESLKLSDYLMSDYVNQNGDSVNFYVAYYSSQRSGEAAHSPRSCIPGGGWEINNMSQYKLADVNYKGESLIVNRLQIQKGDYRHLVYYWFQQRDRIVTNEYLVKWYLFQDALTRNRTDGALIRISTRIPPGASWESADQNLKSFARNVVTALTDFIPD